jgi:hypothetical protein
VPRRFHLVASALSLAIAIALAGCGGGSETVVRFDGATHASIDRQTLDHWMQALAGSDIRENLGAEGPTGLASEPADPKRCFAAAKLVAPRSFFNQIRYDREQVEEKCRQLHRAIEEQALSFLIGAQSTLTEAAEHGLAATAGEVRRELAASRERYPTEVDLHRYLRERQWSLADLLYQVKLAILRGKLHAQSAQPLQLSATEPPYPDASVSFHPGTHLTAICAKGYVATGCSAQRGSASASTSASVVLAHLTGKGLESPP